MGPTPFSEGNHHETQTKIMKATYRALQKYGYAALSISKIAEEADMSKSALYNHYEGKDDLLLAFLEFIITEYRNEMLPDRSHTSLERVRSLPQLLLSFENDSKSGTEPVDIELLRAVVELQAQAIHNDTFQYPLTGDERHKHDRLARIIEHGIEDGHFREVDPDAAATFIQTIIQGALFRQITTGMVSLELVQQELDAYIQCRLLAPQ